ncbi:MAG: hypothetical protein GXP04_08200 [Alphaproteobacteria bacterium]|nr:hypothetical protein [Alphaproteobacteria bacterium]
MGDLFLRPTFHGLVAALMIGLSFFVLLRLTRNRASLWPIFYTMLLITMVSTYVLGFGHNSWVRTWTTEDQQVEWTSFWLALMAAGCAGVAAWRARPRSAGLLSAGLAALGVVLAGEEIAWGYRKLGFDLPDVFAKHNRQNELTIHNLEILGTPIASWLQAFAPLLLILGFFVWQYTFRKAADQYAGFRFHPHVAAFSLTFAAFFFLSSYGFPLRVVEDIPLARIPVEMFRRHASSQSELSELLFAAFLLLAAMALWRHFAELSGRSPHKRR